MIWDARTGWMERKTGVGEDAAVLGSGADPPKKLCPCSKLDTGTSPPPKQSSKHGGLQVRVPHFPPSNVDPLYNCRRERQRKKKGFLLC